MKERPILFSAPMVRAILEGRKTQTRRIMNPQPHTTTTAIRDIPDTRYWYGAIHTENDFGIEFHPDPALGDWKWRCPYGIPGDRLYVKEAVWVWCHKKPNGTTKKGRPKFRYVPHSSRSFFYVADHPTKPERTSYADPDMVWRYKTARFMPRWASRITLEVIDVRVQRVQEISKKDAKEEGIRYLPEAHSWSSDEEYQGLGRLMTPISAFAELWDSINAKKYPWASNPWVWAITFRRIDLPA